LLCALAACGRVGFDPRDAFDAAPAPACARAIGTGVSHSCAITETGALQCWGDNDWGQLGAQQKFDPVTVWGFVLFNWDRTAQAYRPVDYMQLSEAACWYLDGYYD